MFYVKGKSFILSFSNRPTSSDILLSASEEQRQGLVTINDKETHSSAILHYLWGSIDMLPTFLAAASSMAMIVYFYTVILLPTVMMATIANLDNTTLSNTTMNGTEVPLDTKCPLLKPRDAPAQSVHDLRPDDIRIVLGLGDRYAIFFFFFHYYYVQHDQYHCFFIA
jgi:hypothetical protein